MKLYLLLFLIFILSACSAQRGSLSNLEKSQETSLKNCPPGYDCSLKITPNRSLLLRKDEFGILYAETVNSNRILIKYEFKRKIVDKTADGHFIEAVYFTIQKTDNNIVLKDRNLEKVNMVLHRQCYCKGSTGYFKIKNGNFRLSIKKNELTLNTDFSINNIPHLLQKINEKMILEY